MEIELTSYSIEPKADELVCISGSSDIDRDDGVTERTKLIRTQSIKQAVMKNALNFFVPENEEVQEKWDQTRLRLGSRLGQMKTSGCLKVEETNDMHSSSIVQHAMAENNTKKRQRENAAKLLWRSASEKLLNKPQNAASTKDSVPGRSDISVSGSVSQFEYPSDTPSSGLPPSLSCNDEPIIDEDEEESIIDEEQEDGDGDGELSAAVSGSVSQLEYPSDTPSPGLPPSLFCNDEPIIDKDEEEPIIDEEQEDGDGELSAAVSGSVSQLEYPSDTPSPGLPPSLFCNDEPIIDKDEEEPIIDEEQEDGDGDGELSASVSGSVSQLEYPSDTPSSGLPPSLSCNDEPIIDEDEEEPIIDEKQEDGDGDGELSAMPTPKIEHQVQSTSTYKVESTSHQISKQCNCITNKRKKKKHKIKDYCESVLNISKNKITSEQQKQIEESKDYRPFFTYWLSFVQLVILIVMISVYPFAPIGVSERSTQKDILVSRNGVLGIEEKVKKEVENFWIGPTLPTLIILGAKYAPCMRHDNQLYRELLYERGYENNTGCCIQTHNTGCIQRRKRECSSSFTTYRPSTVCGQDPKACLTPPSKPPNEWGMLPITEWPVCQKSANITQLPREDYPHMHCEITGRPCCIGTQAECIITNRDYCDFKDGVYHADKTLCSQVDCLASTCGLLPFVKQDQPDQIYRLWLSLFLHAGILHFVIVLIFNFTILHYIEKGAGWLRISLIYLLSGIGGSLWSSILLPYSPEVGPSGSCFGIIACLIVNYIQDWHLYKAPWIGFSKLCGLVLVLFLFGLLPYIDNFAHIFGFVYGFFLSIIFLPYITFGDWDRRRKKIQVLVAIPVLFVITTVGFILFYRVQEFHSDAITFFNCIPITDNFCKNYHQGQSLESRGVDF